MNGLPVNTTVLAAAIGSATALVVAVFSFAQWMVGHREALRRRDTDLVFWGNEVIKNMCNIEYWCIYNIKARSHREYELESLASEASYLVDKGRTFFQNYKEVNIEHGLRPKILDEALRSHYIAYKIMNDNHAMSNIDLIDLRQKIWVVRREFVFLLQNEMGRSIRKASKKSIGTSICPDPTSWEYTNFSDKDREYLNQVQPHV